MYLKLKLDRDNEFMILVHYLENLCSLYLVNYFSGV